MRFLDHVLPAGFVKIRHFGLLASGNVRSRLKRARELLGGTVEPEDAPSVGDDDFRDVLLRTTGFDLRQCPRCQQHAVERRPLPERTGAPSRAPPTEVAA